MTKMADKRETNLFIREIAGKLSGQRQEAFRKAKGEQKNKQVIVHIWPSLPFPSFFPKSDWIGDILSLGSRNHTDRK